MLVVDVLDVVVDDVSPLSLESLLEEPEPVYALGLLFVADFSPFGVSRLSTSSFGELAGPYQYR